MPCSHSHLKRLSCIVEPEAPQSQKLSSPAQPAANRSQGGASDHDPDSDAASESDCDEEPEEDTRVVLKLQCSKGVLNLRTRTQGAMSNLFAAFKAQAKSKGWIQDVQMPMKFVFEGDPLTGKETAESLDLEGDEILEVRW